jgi:type IV pilus assembly protein PilX
MKPQMQKRQQYGMALIVSLIILLVLTLLGLAAVQNSSMEERMAGNMRRENIAFQAAEAGLRSGEEWLFGLTSRPVAGQNVTGADGKTLKLWRFGLESDLASPESVKKITATNWWQEWVQADWINNSYTAASDNPLEFTGDGSVLPAQPRFLIEERGVVTDSLVRGQPQDELGGGRTFYQVTARGLDSTSRSEVILRSTYARRF